MNRLARSASVVCLLALMAVATVACGGGGDDDLEAFRVTTTTGEPGTEPDAGVPDRSFTTASTAPLTTVALPQPPSTRTELLPPAGRDLPEGYVFNFGPEVPQQEQEAVRQGVALARALGVSNYGYALESLSVFVDRDAQRLTDSYVKFRNLRPTAAFIETKRTQFRDGTVEPVSGGIFAADFRLTPDLYLSMGHAYFHTLQFQLMGRQRANAPQGDGIPSYGVYWLLQGSAELFGQLASAQQSGTGLAAVKAALVRVAGADTFPLGARESIPGWKVSQLSYPLSALAVEMLIREHGGLASLLRFYNEVGANRPWRDVFQQVFGVSLADFYVQFNGYRARGFT